VERSDAIIQQFREAGATEKERERESGRERQKERERERVGERHACCDCKTISFLQLLGALSANEAPLSLTRDNQIRTHLEADGAFRKWFLFRESFCEVIAAAAATASEQNLA
jgi:hypothetical protein